MVIEESDMFPGKFEVTEMREGCNAEKAGIQKGDLLRGITSKSNVFRTDMKTAKQVMKAVESNKAMGYAGLIIERRIETNKDNSLVKDAQEFVSK